MGNDNNHIIVALDKTEGVYSSQTKSVTVHSSPEVYVEGNKVIRNYDIFFSLFPTVDSELCLLDPDRTVRIPFKNKLAQRIGLIEAENRYLLATGNGIPKSYMSVLTYPGYGATQKPADLLGLPVLLKPIQLARGMGQFMLGEQVQPLLFLKGCLENRRLQGGFREAMEKAFPGVTSYYTGNERYIGESDEHVGRLTARDYLIQEVVQNISAEYRLITGPMGMIAGSFRRNLYTYPDGYTQASGEGLANNEESFTETLSQEESHFLRYLLTHATGPLASVDIFVTSEGRWGIFEYSSEWGAAGVPRAVCDAALEATARHCLTHGCKSV